ncbi:MAG: HNH endonuclease [Streptomyces sp.]|nr:HNH endonuclease [Streptomyces sp.]
MKRRTTFALLTAAAAVLGSVPAVAHADGPGTRTAIVQELIAELPVAAEHRDGYVRTAFRHWIDADKDGCNTRQEVLKQEAVEPPTQEANCKLVGGEWFSYYDDAEIDGSSGLDIDHMVPLAEAWDSGAYDWTAQRRQAYANDLGWSRSLVAVSARTNRQKADQDPSDWTPPAADAKCHYLADWVSVKTRWGLSVDPAEHQALTELAAGCQEETLDVPIA